MTEMRNHFTVFTKPWPETPLDELARFIGELGFDGVELPVRPGFQVTPENVGERLAEAADIFRRRGLRVASVAGSDDLETIAAMGAAGVPLLRICEPIDMEIGYLATEARLRAKYDRLLGALEEHGVTLGIQNHCGCYVGSAIGLMHLIEEYDPRRVAAVLDCAHCGLDGENDAMAIDIVYSHLALVNLKSGLWVAEEHPETGEVTWKSRWVPARKGITSWPAVAAELKKRGYSGDLCLSAEYSRPEGGDYTGRDVVALVADDLAYARSLFV
jgi:sugar phosphate isomerase/epimerase